jgi:hypothetical protein
MRPKRASNAQFSTSYPQTYQQGQQGGRAMGYRSNSRSELRAEASLRQRQFRPRARDILISWTRAREYRDKEASYLQRVQSASDPDARERFIGIAQHYRSLAKIEQNIADQRPTKMGEN